MNSSDYSVPRPRHKKNINLAKRISLSILMIKQMMMGKVSRLIKWHRLRKTRKRKRRAIFHVILILKKSIYRSLLRTTHQVKEKYQNSNRSYNIFSSMMVRVIKIQISMIPIAKV